MRVKGRKPPQRHRAKWSAEDLEYLQRSYGKISEMEISQHLQRTEWAIDSKARRVGLKVGRGESPLKKMITEALEKQNLSRGELSKLLGVPFSSLHKSLMALQNNRKVASYTRKDVVGLGRRKVIYTLEKEAKPSVGEKVEV